MNKSYVGKGKVILIAGGGEIYTDIAARFVGSERSLKEIIASPYDKNIVENIINSNHLTSTEFDYFIFGVEGYSRVTEIQLVRKRIASYLIKSGRKDKNGKRNFDVVIPEEIENFAISTEIHPGNVILPDGKCLADICSQEAGKYKLRISSQDILNFIENWYNTGINLGYKEENLRYLKPQATEFKAIIGMNVHSLLDWFQIRTCLNAQDEIHDMATKMLKICKEAAPDLFKNAGPNCKVLGYCPENKLQNEKCKGKIPIKEEALEIIKNNYKHVSENDKKECHIYYYGGNN
jgi:thymidylate synthase (FAD)